MTIVLIKLKKTATIIDNVPFKKMVDSISFFLKYKYIYMYIHNTTVFRQFADHKCFITVILYLTHINTSPAALKKCYQEAIKGILHVFLYQYNFELKLIYSI